MEEEEGGVVNPFANIEKSSVMQESRKFNAMPIKPRECSLILAKIMYIPIFLFFWGKHVTGGGGEGINLAPHFLFASLCSYAN